MIKILEALLPVLLMMGLGAFCKVLAEAGKY